MASPRRLQAVVYVRLSVHRGETDPSTSPERQRESCEAWALSKGWDVVEVVEDLNISGSDKGLRLNRPGLRRVRELLPSVDVVLFAKLDRLARNVIDFRAFSEEAESHGASLVSVAESLDLTASTGRFVATILSAFAEMEAATIAERTRAGKAGAVTRLRWANGAAPFGYHSIPHSGGAGRGLEIDPEEAGHLRAAADHVLNGGSLYGALQLIRARGSRPRRAAAWSISSLKVVLTGTAVVGQMTHRGQLLRDEHGLPLQVWPPALPLEDVERLRAALTPRPRGQQRRKATRLLSGLVWCSSCGASMRLGTSAGSARYSCRAYSDGHECSRPVSIKADHLEDYVARRFLASLGDLPVTERIESRRDVAGLAAVGSAIRDIGLLITEPGADIAALAAQLTDLHARRSVLEDAVDVEVVLRSTGRSIAETWLTEDVAGRRRLIEGNTAGCVIQRGTRGRHALEESRVALIFTAPSVAGYGPARPGKAVILDDVNS
ncbi:MAG: recombinase family protein [Actinomycetota bacterium]|nr:recombinase family protein [Actinomycetota bacterium]